MSEKHARTILAAGDRFEEVAKKVERKYKQGGVIPSVREIERMSERRGGSREPAEEASREEPVYTEEVWECPVCRALYELYHLSPEKHVIKLVRKGHAGA